MTPLDDNLKRRLKKYGLTLEEFRALERRSGGVCEICGRPPKNIALSIDHEHQRNWSKKPPEERAKAVRGLLCWAHNTGLKKWQDNPELLEAAAAYLRRYEDGKTKEDTNTPNRKRNTKKARLSSSKRPASKLAA